MQNHFFRLIGSALLLDGILVIITLPLTRLVMAMLLPSNLISAQGILWTYGMVIFGLLLAVMLIALWIFQAWYAHLFTFWQLIIAMLVIMCGILWWNKGV